MRNLIIGVILLGAGFFLTSCGDGPIPSLEQSEDKPAANDYMPFLIAGYLIRWQQNTTIRILLPDASSITGGNSTMDDSFRAGVAEWNSVLADLGITVSYVTSGSHEVTVIWDDGTLLGTTAVGRATYVEGGSPSRYIVMSTRCMNCPVPIPMYSFQIQAIAAHEFGHMLGIWNHSFDRNDRMNPSAGYAYTVSGRDIATMKYLYNFSPDFDLSAEGANTKMAVDFFDSDFEGKVYVRETLGYDPKDTMIEFSFPAGLEPMGQKK